MTSFPKHTIAAVIIVALTGCAHPLSDPHQHRPAAESSPAVASPLADESGERMAMMDTHMQSMREMHDRFARARTPDERSALMAEHDKLMHESMAMMDGMGSGAPGSGAAPGDKQAHHQMMEKRMEMMRSMMKMMMDRLPPVTGKH